MKSMSIYINTLEQYRQLEVSIIRETKINKVLKGIIKLSSIPQDAEYNFKRRSHDLLTSWNTLLAADTEGAPASAVEEEGTTNGISKPTEASGTTSPKPAAIEKTSEKDTSEDRAEKPAEETTTEEKPVEKAATSAPAEEKVAAPTEPIKSTEVESKTTESEKPAEAAAAVETST
jgi:hypothetical protein